MKFSEIYEKAGEARLTNMEMLLVTARELTREPLSGDESEERIQAGQKLVRENLPDGDRATQLVKLFSAISSLVMMQAMIKTIAVVSTRSGGEA